MTTKPTTDQITHEGELLSDVLAAIAAPDALTEQAIVSVLGYLPVNPAAAALTGTPTVPTAPPGTASTQAASTEFVSAAVAAVSGSGGSPTAGVTSFNSRTGAVTLGAADVVGALTASSATKSLVWPNSGTASNVYMQRNANYTGGSLGHVYGALYLETFTPTGTHNAFEWGLTSVMHSRSVKSNVTGGTSGEGFGTAPQNVAINGTAFRTAGDAPIWGGNFVAYQKTVEYTGAQGPLHGVEVNVGGNGIDTGENSIGVFVVPQVQTDLPGPGVFEGWSGIWLIGDATSSSRWRTGITNQAGRERGYHDRGNHIVGIDLADANNSDSALRIKAKDWIALDGSSQYKLRFDSDTGRLQFYGNGANRGYINLTSGADADLAGGAGGSYVDLSTNQTVGGVKSFSNGIVLPSAGVTLGVGIGTYGSMSNWGASQARAFTDSTTLNIDSLCTSGTLRSFMSTTPTNEQVEVALRPLYCIVSALVKALQDRKVI